MPIHHIYMYHIGPSVFQTLRAAWLAADMSELLKTHEKKLKPELVWNIRKGMELSAADCLTSAPMGQISGIA